jgi:predicted RNase H-like nuclease (RuvC/YqgF family)
VDPTVTVAIISTAGVVLAGIFTLLGVRFTQRQSRAAAAATAALDRDKVDANAYEAARETWTETVAELRRQVAELRDEAEAVRRGGRELRARVDELESTRAADRQTIREFRDYARALLAILVAHELPYPPPPPGLDLPPIL